MKKFIYTPLWRIEECESALRQIEQNGYRVTGVKGSHWFTFNEKSNSKQMRYFLLPNAHKTLGGRELVRCECDLRSQHSANPIDTESCRFSVYRIAESEDLTALCKLRADCIKRMLLEFALTALFIVVVFAVLLIAVIMATDRKAIAAASAVTASVACFTVYCFYGYFKQRGRCKRIKSQ